MLLRPWRCFLRTVRGRDFRGLTLGKNNRLQIGLVFLDLLVLLGIMVLKPIEGQPFDPVLDITVLTHDHWVHAVAFSPDGQLLATGSGRLNYCGDVRLWGVATGELKATLQGHSGAVNVVAFAPDGRTLATGSEDTTVRLWDAASGQQLAVLQGNQGRLLSLAYSPDGRTLAVSGPEGPVTVTLWDVATRTKRTTLTGCGPVSFAPGGKMLATGCSDTTVRFWDLATGQVRDPLPGPAKRFYHLIFAPNGGILAAGDARTIEVWDLNPCRVRFTLREHTDWLGSVALTPDGRQLATAGNDRIVKLWDVATVKKRATLDGHTGPVHSMGFSPDGKWLATASYDRTVRLWDVGDYAP